MKALIAIMLAFVVGVTPVCGQCVGGVCRSGSTARAARQPHARGVVRAIVSHHPAVVIAKRLLKR